MPFRSHENPSVSRSRVQCVDPFYTLPIGKAGQTQFLIHHCELSARISSVSPRESLAELMLNQQANIIGGPNPFLLPLPA